MGSESIIHILNKALSPFQPSASPAQCGRCSSEVLDVLPVHFLPLPLSEPLPIPCSGRIMNPMARWAAPALLPWQQFATGFLVALDLLQNPSSKGAQFPTSALAHQFCCSVSRKGKERIDLEDKFYLFNKETEEVGYFELP